MRQGVCRPAGTASASLGQREGREFQRLPEKPPSPAAKRRFPLAVTRYHPVCTHFDNRRNRSGS